MKRSEEVDQKNGKNTLGGSIKIITYSVYKALKPCTISCGSILALYCMMDNKLSFKIYTVENSCEFQGVWLTERRFLTSEVLTKCEWEGRKKRRWFEGKEHYTIMYQLHHQSSLKV